MLREKVANKEKNRYLWQVIVLLILSAALILGFGAMRTVSAAGNERLSKKKLSVYQGQAAKLKVKNASVKVQWTSSDPTIAEVSGKGKVKALKPGRCIIEAVVGDTELTCRVKVKPVKFSKAALTMVRGRQEKLTFNYTGVKNAQWSSSDPKVAQVQDGIVLAKNPGKTVIKALWRGIEFHCSVTVTGISADLLTAAYPAGKEYRGRIILAGSSSMDYWVNALQAFEPYAILNTAIGGTTVTQWLTWYKGLIVRYKPQAVVLYVGSNDINNGKGISGEENAANTILLLDRITKELKKTPVFYVSINPCWLRKDAWGKIRTSNALVKAYCGKKKYVYYIDITSASSLPNGTPDPALFLSDKIHPSEQGYIKRKKQIAKKVKKIVKKLEKKKKKGKKS